MDELSLHDEEEDIEGVCDSPNDPEAVQWLVILLLMLYQVF